MRNWALNIFEIVKHIVPHYLQKSGLNNLWVTPDGNIWVTPGGLGWGFESMDKHLEWIKSLVSPIQWLNEAFVQFVNKSIYRLNISGQVIYLEHLLNDSLDNEERRIFIGDGDLVLPPYLYAKVDNKPTSLWLKSEEENPLYLYTKQDYLIGQTLFIIYVPIEIPISIELEAIIRSLVDPYRMAGALYTIENY